MNILNYNSIICRKRAITSCPEAQTLEQVMEWLIAHEDELNSEPTDSTPVVTEKQSSQPKQVTATTGIQNNQDCNTTIDGESKREETAVEEAARKKITVEEAQRLIAKRLAIRAEEERKKAIEDEKKRREVGQKILETRQELQDQERIRLAQQIRREKLEKELHKKQVLEQIARDREAMKNKSKPLVTNETSSRSSSTSANSTSTTPKTLASECKLALRFPDGSSKVHKFSPQEQLSAVRLFVQLEKAYAQTAKVEFVAPPNKKLTDSEMSETLESLGLCPASRLEVKYNQSAFVDLD